GGGRGGGGGGGQLGQLDRGRGHDLAGRALVVRAHVLLGGRGHVQKDSSAAERGGGEQRGAADHEALEGALAGAQPRQHLLGLLLVALELEHAAEQADRAGAVAGAGGRLG